MFDLNYSIQTITIIESSKSANNSGLLFKEISSTFIYHSNGILIII